MLQHSKQPRRSHITFTFLPLYQPCILETCFSGPWSHRDLSHIRRFGLCVPSAWLTLLSFLHWGSLLPRKPLLMLLENIPGDPPEWSGAPYTSPYQKVGSLIFCLLRRLNVSLTKLGSWGAGLRLLCSQFLTYSRQWKSDYQMKEGMHWWKNISAALVNIAFIGSITDRQTWTHTHTHVPR